MLEIHLFINPLAKSCLLSEQDILQISQQTATKINYQFVPLVNMKTIQETLEIHNMASACPQRNQVAKLQYQLAIDYKAALCQGGLRGRKFLLSLQNAILQQNLDYNEALLKELSQKVGLDWDEFLDDRQSSNVKKYFLQDQQLADKLGVHQVDTAVICNTDDPEYAVLMNNFCLKSFLDYVDAKKSLVKQHLVPQAQGSSAAKNHRILPLH